MMRLTWLRWNAAAASYLAPCRRRHNSTSSCLVPASASKLPRNRLMFAVFSSPRCHILLLLIHIKSPVISIGNDWYVRVPSAEYMVSARLVFGRSFFYSSRIHTRMHLPPMYDTRQYKPVLVRTRSTSCNMLRYSTCFCTRSLVVRAKGSSTKAVIVCIMVVFIVWNSKSLRFLISDTSYADYRY